MTDAEKIAVIDMQLELASRGQLRVASWNDGSTYSVHLWPKDGGFILTHGSLPDAVRQCLNKVKGMEANNAR